MSRWCVRMTSQTEHHRRVREISTNGGEKRREGRKSWVLDYSFLQRLRHGTGTVLGQRLLPRLPSREALQLHVVGPEDHTEELGLKLHYWYIITVCMKQKSTTSARRHRYKYNNNRRL